jgi:LysM repeat protein
VATARGQEGALAEASRLLQEGLALLDERTREVEQAEARARDMTAEAERRAQEIVAHAEQRRTDLEQQIAALQSEIAAVREEIARLRTTARGRGSRIGPGNDEVAPAAAPLPLPAESPEPPANHASDDSTRWGRPSAGVAPQAIRTRAARPCWLPRVWPFLLLLVPLALVVANVLGQEGPRTGTDERGLRDTAQAASATLVVTFAPTATELAVVATPTAALSTVPPTAVPTPLFVATAVPTPTRAVPTPTLAPTAVPIAVPPPRAPVASSAVPPPTESVDGAIVAVYTTYQTYSVRAGDTLNVVALQFGVTSESISRASGLTDPNLLRPGQILTIPRESGWLYRVQPNETLEQIATRFGTSLEDLLSASQLNAAVVRSGDVVFIPNHALPTIK